MSHELWNPTVETMPQNELKELQLKLIKSQLNYVYTNSSWYHKLYKEANVKLEDIKTIDDFKQKIPVFNKDDLREEQRKTGDPFAGLCCVPREELVNIWTSTGTTGMPTLGAWTRNDVYIATEIFARFLWDGGFRPEMKAITISMNWHWVMTPILNTATRIGMETIAYEFPHPLFVDRWVKWATLYKPDAYAISKELFTTFLPSALKQAGYEPSEVLSSAKIALTLGEPFLTTADRQEMKKTWPNAKIREGVGCGESYLWFFEACDEHLYGHAWSDIALPELLDPDTHETVAPGERGEIVATNLRVKGIPYIRFCTEDLAEIWTEPCERGITHPHANVLVRTGWRVKVGKKAFIPPDVEPTLKKHPETSKALFCIVKYSENMDKLRVHVAYDPDITKDPDQLKTALTDELEKKLGAKVEIKWVPEEEIPRPAPHKIAKFQDLTKA